MSSRLHAPVSGVPSNKRIRITQAGKMNSYVYWSLEQLMIPDSSITLHTAPPSAGSSSRAAIAEAGEAEDSAKVKAASEKYHSTSLMPCTSTIPRLVSVVEIVKREYPSRLAATRAGRKPAGAPSDAGDAVSDGKMAPPKLWQYNRLVSLSRTEREEAYPTAVTKTRTKKRKSAADEALDIVDLDELDEDGRQLRDMLNRGKSVQMIHTPYMETTLSNRPLSDLQRAQGVTCQVVQYKTVKKKTRSTKRSRKESAAAGEDDAPPDDSAEQVSMVPDSMEAEGES